MMMWDLLYPGDEETSAACYEMLLWQYDMRFHNEDWAVSWRD